MIVADLLLVKVGRLPLFRMFGEHKLFDVNYKWALRFRVTFALKIWFDLIWSKAKRTIQRGLLMNFRPLIHFPNGLKPTKTIFNVTVLAVH